MYHAGAEADSYSAEAYAGRISLACSQSRQQLKQFGGPIGDFVVGGGKIFRRDLNALSVEAQHLDVMTLVSATFRSVPWHKRWRGMESNLYP
jgi:hypothetical protein